MIARWVVGLATALQVLGTVQSAMAQGYRLRLDLRGQHVEFRGWRLDSIPVTDVVTGANGGLQTPDGFAVKCNPGFAFCTYYEAGPIQTGDPVVTAMNLRLWGLGVRGLSVQTTVRWRVELADTNAWPGTDPPFEMVEGYVEYAARRFTALGGRLLLSDRFGMTGLDGASFQYNAFSHSLNIAAYGGWGLAHGASLPITSSALNPLDDFQPGKRQLVAGGSVGWSRSGVDTRVLYQQQWDSRNSNIWSQQLGFDVALSPGARVTIAGGVDYDIAQGLLGNAEARVTYGLPRQLGALSVGGRRYRPHFDLWQIWAAFSPVPYQAAFGIAEFTLTRGLDLVARGEVYKFDDTETSSPLVNVEDSGWRAVIRGTYSAPRIWTFGAAWHGEFGPGAAAYGFDANVNLEPTKTLWFSLDGRYLERPLEYRYDDSKVWSFGLDANYEPEPRIRFLLDLRWYNENRERPDAAQFEWDYLRLNVGVTLLFSSTPKTGLHPAIMSIPLRGGAQ